MNKNEQVVTAIYWERIFGLFRLCDFSPNTPSHNPPWREWDFLRDEERRVGGWVEVQKNPEVRW